MADSPSLSDTPSFDSSYIENIYQQFANFALVFNFPHFFPFLDFFSFRGCENKGEETLQCLRSSPSEALIRAGRLTTATRPSTLYLFAPIIDGTFLLERPVEAFTAGRFARVRVLTG
jgi:hypothetical protein